MDWHPILSPGLRELLVPEPLQPLGPGQPNRAVHAKLKALTVDSALAPQAVCDRAMANCCLAGVWLLHSFVDESHSISQDIDTPTGSYWHGILHRREPDFANAKYWFRRVGSHPVFEPLQVEAGLLTARSDDQRVAGIAAWPSWDPFAFIDLCAAAQGGGSTETACVQIQQLEWRLLLEYCYRQAIGT
jgi:hypothetical protein